MARERDEEAIKTNYQVLEDVLSAAIVQQMSNEYQKPRPRSRRRKRKSSRPSTVENRSEAMDYGKSPTQHASEVQDFVEVGIVSTILSLSSE